MTIVDERPNPQIVEFDQTVLACTYTLADSISKTPIVLLRSRVLRYLRASDRSGHPKWRHTMINLATGEEFSDHPEQLRYLPINTVATVKAPKD